MIEITDTTTEHIPGLKQLLRTVELFPPEMLDEMISDFLHNDATEELWLSALDGEQVMGFAYAVPEALTEGTYNLLAIGVLEEASGQGIGSQMLQSVEDKLRAAQARLIIVESSGQSYYDDARQFYLTHGYEQEAVIKEFWAEGDDKVIFTKHVQASN